MITLTKNKIILYCMLLLISVIVIQFFLYKMNIHNLEEENDKLLNKEKIELRKVRDSAFVEIDKIIKESELKFDSISNESKKIKYIRYEKLTYVDRSVNDAINVIADYKYNERTGE